MQLLSVFCAFILLAEISCHAITSKSENEWEKFKVKYGKVYEGAEDAKRHMIWKATMQYIDTHNREADKGHHSYRLGVNAFADLTPKERRVVLNTNVPSPDNKYCTDKPDFKHDTLPESLDYRKQGYVTPVPNEGMCGSPWAFSATGAMESRQAIKCPLHRLIRLSAQNLVDCSTKYGNYGCSGGFMDNAFGYVKDNHGIDTEASYPYTGKDEKCMFDPTTVGAQISGCVDLPVGNETAMQIILFTGGPVSVGIQADISSFQFYKSGVYDDPACTGKELDHAALVVGYGVMDGKKYWIVKNSWGINWGMEGYILVARNKGNMCGIANLASYPEMICS